MDMRQLELLVAVVDLASVTRAGEKMHLSAGAISLQLHNLADELQFEVTVLPTEDIVAGLVDRRGLMETLFRDLEIAPRVVMEAGFA